MSERERERKRERGRKGRREGERERGRERGETERGWDQVNIQYILHCYLHNNNYMAAKIILL